MDLMGRGYLPNNRPWWDSNREPCESKKSFFTTKPQLLHNIDLPSITVLIITYVFYPLFLTIIYFLNIFTFYRILLKSKLIKSEILCQDISLQR